MITEQHMSCFVSVTVIFVQSIHKSKLTLFPAPMLFVSLEKFHAQRLT